VSASFFGGRGFSLYHAWGRGSSVPLNPHFHDEYLICAQLRGRESCHVGGKLHHFAPGDLVLINPQQVHTGNAEAEAQLEYVSLYVDRVYVAQLAAECGAPTSTPEFTVVQAVNRGPLIAALIELLEHVRERAGGPLYPGPRPTHDDEVQRFVLPSAAAATSRDVGPLHVDGLAIEAALRNVVAQAFEELSNLRMPVLRTTNRVPHPKIARAVDFIRSRPPEADPAAITLDELAAVADLSKYHFLRQFDQVVGMTPGAYLRTLRLCHAARKLRTTDAPIVDIALAVGFADHPSFSRAFARTMGLTPSEYRALGPL